jgi:hypothetical protein
MGLYSKPPPPPNYQPLIDSQVRIGNESLELQKQLLEQSRADAAWNKEIAQPIIDESLRQMKEQAEFARGERENYLTNYRPVEEEYRKEALAFDTPERQEAEAGRAESAVGQAFDANTDAARRRLQRFGIDPSMLRSGALELGSSLERATAQAQAGTDARRRTEDMGRALKGEVINLGRGMPSTVAQSYGSAQQGGSAASGTGLNQTNSAMNAANSTGQWTSSALSGFSGAGNMMDTQYQNKLDNFAAGQASGLAVLGALGGVASAAIPKMKFAEGGVVPHEVSPSGGAIPDDIDARVTAGEYIIPNDVVRWKGEQFFEKLKQTAQREREGVLA